MRCCRADDSPYQRHAVRRAAARNAPIIAAHRVTRCRSASIARHPRGTTAIEEPAAGRAHWQASNSLARKGFRVRLAATVATDAEAEEFRHFLPLTLSTRSGGPGCSD